MPQGYGKKQWCDLKMSKNDSLSNLHNLFTLKGRSIQSSDFFEMNFVTYYFKMMCQLIWASIKYFYGTLYGTSLDADNNLHVQPQDGRHAEDLNISSLPIEQTWCGPDLFNMIAE